MIFNPISPQFSAFSADFASFVLAFAITTMDKPPQEGSAPLITLGATGEAASVAAYASFVLAFATNPIDEPPTLGISSLRTFYTPSKIHWSLHLISVYVIGRVNLIFYIHYKYIVYI